MRKRADIRRLIASLLLPSLLAACESRRAGENNEPDRPSAAPPAERPDPAGSGSPAPAAEHPRDPGNEEAINSVVRIGVVDGDDTQIFGRIRELVVDDAVEFSAPDQVTITVLSQPSAITGPCAG